MEDHLYFFRIIKANFHIFDLQLPPLAPNVFCFSNHQGAVFSSSYSFHVCHLFFNIIMKKIFSSSNTPNTIGISVTITGNIIELHWLMKYSLILCISIIIHSQFIYYSSLKSRTLHWKDVVVFGLVK